jgi:hypothetical protein
MVPVHVAVGLKFQVVAIVELKRGAGPAIIAFTATNIGTLVVSLMKASSFLMVGENISAFCCSVSFYQKTSIGLG